MKKKIFILLTAACILLLTSQAFGANYYVSNKGNDNNSGTSQISQWLTLSKVNSFSFSPGDTINFERGSSWSGGLVIKSSGVQGNPITITAYGSGGAPVIRNSGTYSNSIRLYGDWIVVENLLLRDSQQSGVFIEPGADHNVIQDSEFTNMGSAVLFKGQYNHATRNKVHDMKMIVNTSNVYDDDYGANGFIVGSPNNEISYNTIWNCFASSYDYGSDGGAIELYGNTSGTYIHHNYAYENDVFLEVGGGSNATTHNVTVAYNISLNNHSIFAGFHNGGTFYTDIVNLQMYNNTIVETVYNRGVIIWASVTPDSGDIIFKNNIVVLDNVNSFSDKLFDRSNNLYYFLKSITLIGGLQSNEAYGDPLFVDAKNMDFHLQPGSPAIDKAVDLGQKMDYDNQQITNIPDIGAFEYMAGGDLNINAPKNLRIVK